MFTFLVMVTWLAMVVYESSFGAYVCLIIRRPAGHHPTIATSALVYSSWAKIDASTLVRFQGSPKDVSLLWRTTRW